MKYLKAVLNAGLIISVIFLLMYCSGSGEEDLPICEECGNYIKEDVKAIETNYGEVCAECVLRDKYAQCKYCGLYFDRDWHSHPNRDYSNIVRLCCDKCAEEKTMDCYFCREAYLEEELAEFTYNNEIYYMCIRHCEGYLDRQPFEICSDGDEICAACVE